MIACSAASAACWFSLCFSYVLPMQSPGAVLWAVIAWYSCWWEMPASTAVACMCRQNQPAGVLRCLWEEYHGRHGTHQRLLGAHLGKVQLHTTCGDAVGAQRLDCFAAHGGQARLLGWGLGVGCIDSGVQVRLASSNCEVGLPSGWLGAVLGAFMWDMSTLTCALCCCVFGSAQAVLLGSTQVVLHAQMLPFKCGKRQSQRLFCCLWPSCARC